MKTEQLNQYVRYLQMRNLSPRTIKTYKSIVLKFLNDVQHPENATADDIITFALKGKASRTREQIIGALKHFYKGVLKTQVDFNYIPKVKREQYIPNILTVQEAQDLINNTSNLKHRAILSVIYYGALRISEAINLKIENISKDGIVKIVQSKGAKDRLVPIPIICLMHLREYYKFYKPADYLFKGQTSLQYSTSSIKKVLTQQLKNNQIQKHIRVHDLRHSRATHLLDNGVDIKYLKQLLGHKKIETTERYLHLTTTSLKNAIQSADYKIAS